MVGIPFFSSSGTAAAPIEKSKSDAGSVAPPNPVGCVGFVIVSIAAPIAHDVSFCCQRNRHNYRLECILFLL
jgi:hypothetical protein